MQFGFVGKTHYLLVYLEGYRVSLVWIIFANMTTTIRPLQLSVLNENKAVRIHLGIIYNFEIIATINGYTHETLALWKMSVNIFNSKIILGRFLFPKYYYLEDLQNSVEYGVIFALTTVAEVKSIVQKRIAQCNL